MTKRLLTYPELADYFQVTPRTVRTWVQAREIPFVKMASVVRFDLDAVIEAKTVKPTKVEL